MSRYQIVLIFVFAHLAIIIDSQRERRPARDYGIEVPGTRGINVSSVAITGRPLINSQSESDDGFDPGFDRNRLSSTRLPQPRRPFNSQTGSVNGDSIGRRDQIQNTRSPQTRRPLINSQIGSDGDFYNLGSRDQIPSTRLPQPSRKKDRRPQSESVIFPNRRTTDGSDSTEQTDGHRKKDQKKKRIKNKLKGSHDRGHRVGWSSVKVGDEEHL